MTIAPNPIAEKSPARISIALIVSLFALADMSSIGVSGLLAYVLCLRPTLSEIDLHYMAAITAGVAIAAFVFHQLKIYRPECSSSIRMCLWRLIAGWIAAFGVLLLITLSFKTAATYSIEWAVAWFLSATAVLPMSRVGLTQRVHTWVRDGRTAERVMIVGAGENGQCLVQHLGQRSNCALRIVGVVDDRKTRIPSSVGNYHVLGNVDYLIGMIRNDLVDKVIVALPWSARQRVEEFVSRLALTPVQICQSPGVANFSNSDGRLIHQDGVPMLLLLNRPISGWMYFVKRVEDMSLATTMLICLSPLLIGIWVAIKLDSTGPAIFRQARYGFNNSVFQVLKFRTMYADRTDFSGERQTSRNDPRITRVGRLLRRFSLDELPQLFNVLYGEMSIVGPRAHSISMIVEEKPVEVVVNQYAGRHRVKPGITGWAQVNGLRGELNTVEKARQRTSYDLYYINNWSILLDFVIIAKTPGVILRGPNAY